MNDELKNKSGKVKVMYVRSDDDSDKRTHNPRTGKGEGVRDPLVQTVAVAPPAMNVKARAATVIAAVTVTMTASHPRHGVLFPVRRWMRPRSRTRLPLVAKPLSILK